MANSSAKKLIRANCARLNALKLALLCANLVYAAVTLGLRRASLDAFRLIAWAAVALLCLLPYFFLWTAARPRYFEDGSISHGGEDISRGGLFEYAHDLIYLSLAVQLGLLVSKWALLVFALVPMYAVYAMCAGSQSQSHMSQEEMEGMQADAQLANMSRKERRKAAREARKTK